MNAPAQFMWRWSSSPKPGGELLVEGKALSNLTGLP